MAKLSKQQKRKAKVKAKKQQMIHNQQSLTEHLSAALELALKYFQLAAQQGHADAQENFRLLKEAIDAENKNK